MSLLGSLVSAGASLISGLFSRNDAKKQARKEEKAIKSYNAKQEQLADEMNREVRIRSDAAALVPIQTQSESISQGSVDMDRFMADAEKYGFNPLTYLRSGALAMYGRTDTANFTCTTGERAMEAAQAGQHIPALMPVISQTQVPSVGSVVGGALQAGATQYLNDRTIAENNAFQMELLNRQLQGAARPGSYTGPRSMSVPSAPLFGSVTKPGDSALRNTGHILNWPKTKVEPVTELDDAAASIDQIMVGVRDWWRQSSFRVGTIPNTPADYVKQQVIKNVQTAPDPRKVQRYLTTGNPDPNYVNPAQPGNW